MSLLSLFSVVDTAFKAFEDGDPKKTLNDMIQKVEDGLEAFTKAAEKVTAEPEKIADAVEAQVKRAETVAATANREARRIIDVAKSD